MTSGACCIAAPFSTSMSPLLFLVYILVWGAAAPADSAQVPERELCIDNLLVRIHFIIVMIRWTGLAPWDFEFFFPGSPGAT